MAQHKRKRSIFERERYAIAIREMLRSFRRAANDLAKGNPKEPMSAETRGCIRRLKRILEQRGRGRCYGRYIVRVFGNPQLPKPTSDAGKQISLAVGRYIGMTEGVVRQAPEPLFRDDCGRVSIEKDQRHCGSEIVIVTADDESKEGRAGN